MADRADEIAVASFPCRAAAALAAGALRASPPGQSLMAMAPIGSSSWSGLPRLVRSSRLTRSRRAEKAGAHPATAGGQATVRMEKAPEFSTQSGAGGRLRAAHLPE
jgi:hypothetical protein